ncbi:MAG: NUDIX hydrolase [Halieaceae bacterium]|nr:NUDIX hydrolase [Halieaceae bacterium]
MLNSFRLCYERRYLRLLGLTGLLLGYAGSGHACPWVETPAFAPSAGCLAISGRSILVVENRQGRVGPPGGSAEKGETAPCTAHRETLEETGLDLLPRELLRALDTGFYLYHCELQPHSGEIGPRDSDEIDSAYWLPVDDFDRVQWRFPGQGDVLRNLVPN